MEASLTWLPEASGTPWEKLGAAMNAGLPVPAGYIVSLRTPEPEVRAAYEEMKVQEKTHFVAVRAVSHTVLNVIGSDALIHTTRRLWAESSDTPVLIQRMIHSMWCGKAHWQQENLRIKANEGMMTLDPDTYLVDAGGKCLQSTFEPKQRKMIRHVDGSARVVERPGERAPMMAEQLAKIAELATRVRGDIGWAIDDQDKVWLVSS